jgi:electron transfer flavoprotein alpha subunit
METILFLAHAEADGNPLRRQSLEALNATRQLAESLGTDFAVGLVGGTTQAAADAIATCGAARMFAVDGPEFAAPRYATDADAAEALCRAAGATLVIAPATSRWNRVLAGVSHRLGGKIDTHVTELSAADGAVGVTRWVYRQRMTTELSRTQRPWFLALEGGIAPAWAGEAGSATVEAVKAELPGTRSRVMGVEAPASDQQTIRPDADLLFVAGAGWTKKQADGEVKVAAAEELIMTFVSQAQASLGSTKSLVDLGGEGQEVLTCLSHLNQIGQTGATPRHAKGLATCCHGEEPHTVGWRFIGERRAISLDANCGWARGKADVLYVADAFAVMRELNRLLA